MSGTLTNGLAEIPFENSNAPGRAWQKASRTDLHPIVKDCVLLSEAPDAQGHPSDRVPDGTRMVSLTDSKHENGPVLDFTRVELTKFIEGAKNGEFDEFCASAEELAAAAVAA